MFEPFYLITVSFFSGADSQDSENAESFAFALVNGSIGVFELRNRRVQNFR